MLKRLGNWFTLLRYIFKSEITVHSIKSDGIWNWEYDKGYCYGELDGGEWEYVLLPDNENDAWSLTHVDFGTFTVRSRYELYNTINVIELSENGL